jgi:hypothetical protein
VKRYLLALTLALAGCSKAPDSSVGEPAIGGNAVAGVAFDYRYSLTLPSARIGDLQEDHAKACERLGIARCRITGLRYSVGKQGNVDASLSVKIAASLARGFGRDGVKQAQGMGATLTGADIGGTDVATAAAATAVERSDLASDRARIARELARTDLSPRERTELLQQQAALAKPARAAEAAAVAQRDSLATTPMTFAYRTGRGTGLVDRLRDAGDTALGSIGLTVTALLWVLAALGPPCVAAALLFLLWRRWGRRWWVGLVERIDRA